MSSVWDPIGGFPAQGFPVDTPAGRPVPSDPNDPAIRNLTGLQDGPMLVGGLWNIRGGAPVGLNPNKSAASLNRQFLPFRAGWLAAQKAATKAALGR